MGKCSKRIWALCAAYYNIFACIPAAVFLIILLIVYSQLKELRQDYADTFIKWYAKELNTALMFIWLIMEVTGILICIRCVKGINDVRVDLVTQWLVWKGILTGSYGISISCFIGTDLHWTWLIFPGTNFFVNLILLLIVFLYYQTMPDDSSSEEED